MMTDDTLRNRIGGLDDVELVRMLTITREEQTPEALQLAEAEAARRELPVDEAFLPATESDEAPSGKYETGGIPVICPHCRGREFLARDVLLNTRGLTFFKLDFLNRSATALICTQCGLIQFFAGGASPAD